MVDCAADSILRIGHDKSQSRERGNEAHPPATCICLRRQLTPNQRGRFLRLAGRSWPLNRSCCRIALRRGKHGCEVSSGRRTTRHRPPMLGDHCRDQAGYWPEARGIAGKIQSCTRSSEPQNCGLIRRQYKVFTQICVFAVDRPAGSLHGAETDSAIVRNRKGLADVPPLPDFPLQPNRTPRHDLRLRLDRCFGARLSRLHLRSNRPARSYRNRCCGSCFGWRNAFARRRLCRSRLSRLTQTGTEQCALSFPMMGRFIVLRAGAFVAAAACSTSRAADMPS